MKILSLLLSLLCTLPTAHAVKCDALFIQKKLREYHAKNLTALTERAAKLYLRHKGRPGTPFARLSRRLNTYLDALYIENAEVGKALDLVNLPDKEREYRRFLQQHPTDVPYVEGVRQQYPDIIVVNDQTEDVIEHFYKVYLRFFPHEKEHVATLRRDRPHLLIVTERTRYSMSILWKARLDELFTLLGPKDRKQRADIFEFMDLKMFEELVAENLIDPEGGSRFGLH